MGRFRSLIAQSPAIVISLLAVVLSAGGGAYASTHLSAANSPVASQAAAGVSWTSLALTNGWVSENAAFQTGNPKVAQQSGIVYLSGSLAQPSGSSEVFATLPSADRPTHNLWITVYTFSGTSGTLFIGHDGTMEAFSNSNCNTSQNSAQCFTSLATVSYPVNS